ncbi:AurF N-oxygenase family protein [Cryptosporangium aurantiacum]|uniref:p-aminobenzoate N-oxygenase AurF n=1 Tax=Cryptosporangium aurantiacum TaxID=134849 RepID=A0A1M7RM81_9ACTN|nr:diiron oxygenase [Cryptosporangium aurantiacum]SHN47196.1 P-aminobenzoate N-oxygenase AurF [Cryptosporangium aurantiacum]
MSPSAPLRDRDEVGARLLTASARHSFDPAVDVDWDAPLVDGAPAMPLHRVTLYGTPLWDELTEEQRIALSFHETASMLSIGLWFEIVLMQLLARYVQRMDIRRPHAQYALTEVGDETRHSVMFARTITKLGCPDYRPGRRLQRLGSLYGHLSSGPSLFASVLVVEETLDRLQREGMADETVQPLLRTVSRIHVVEEARHVSYARSEVARTVPKLSRSQLELHRLVTASVAAIVVDAYVRPRAYASIGLDPERARAEARANPHHRETRRWMAERITGFLSEVGLIGGRSTQIWRRADLL